MKQEKHTLFSDIKLIAKILLSFYLLYIIFGLVLGLDIEGILSTLQTLTFYSAAFALLCIGLNLHWGYTGLFNLGVAGFMAVAVYTMAIVTASPNPGPTGVPGLGLPIYIGIIAGILAAALVGVVSAIPALRLKSDYLAIVTLGISEIIRLLYNSQLLESFQLAGVKLGTGGASGISLPTLPIERIFYTSPGDPSSPYTIFGSIVFNKGIRETIIVNWAYTIFFIFILFICYICIHRLIHSPFGRVLKTIRDDELVAKALGKDTRIFKLKVFAVGCGLMGLAGILWQGSQGYTSPGNYRPVLTFFVFVALIMGGAGSNTGSILGGIFFTGFLYIGPRFIGRILNTIQIEPIPNTFIDATAPLLSLDPLPFFFYCLDNISDLRFVILGAILIYFLRKKPNGFLGDRKETSIAGLKDITNEISSEKTNKKE